MSSRRLTLSDLLNEAPVPSPAPLSTSAPAAPVVPTQAALSRTPHSSADREPMSSSIQTLGRSRRTSSPSPSRHPPPDAHHSDRRPFHDPFNDTRSHPPGPPYAAAPRRPSQSPGSQSTSSLHSQRLAVSPARYPQQLPHAPPSPAGAFPQLTPSPVVNTVQQSRSRSSSTSQPFAPQFLQGSSHSTQNVLPSSGYSPSMHRRPANYARVSGNALPSPSSQPPLGGLEALVEVATAEHKRMREDARRRNNSARAAGISPDSSNRRVSGTPSSLHVPPSFEPQSQQTLPDVHHATFAVPRVPASSSRMELEVLTHNRKRKRTSDPQPVAFETPRSLIGPGVSNTRETDSSASLWRKHPAGSLVKRSAESLSEKESEIISLITTGQQSPLYGRRQEPVVHPNEETDLKSTPRTPSRMSEFSGPRRPWEDAPAPPVQPTEASESRSTVSNTPSSNLMGWRDVAQEDTGLLAHVAAHPAPPPIDHSTPVPPLEAVSTVDTVSEVMSSEPEGPLTAVELPNRTSSHDVACPPSDESTFIADVREPSDDLSTRKSTFESTPLLSLALDMTSRPYRAISSDYSSASTHNTTAIENKPTSPRLNSPIRVSPTRVPPLSPRPHSPNSIDLRINTKGVNVERKESTESQHTPVNISQSSDVLPKVQLDVSTLDPLLEVTDNGPLPGTDDKLASSSARTTLDVSSEVSKSPIGIQPLETHNFTLALDDEPARDTIIPEQSIAGIQSHQLTGSHASPTLSNSSQSVIEHSAEIVKQQDLFPVALLDHELEEVAGLEPPTNEVTSVEQYTAREVDIGAQEEHCRNLEDTHKPNHTSSDNDDFDAELLSLVEDKPYHSHERSQMSKRKSKSKHYRAVQHTGTSDTPRRVDQKTSSRLPSPGPPPNRVKTEQETGSTPLNIRERSQTPRDEDRISVTNRKPSKVAAPKKPSAAGPAQPPKARVKSVLTSTKPRPKSSIEASMHSISTSKPKKNTPTTAAKAVASRSRSTSVMPPSSLAQEIKPQPPADGDDSVEEEEEEEERLYCICKTPYDDEKVMIACDRCDEWYHTTCVGMLDLELDLVDQFVCPPCIKKDPLANLQTTYKRRCLLGLRARNPDSPDACHKPARGALSKYCSDDCGIKYMRARIVVWADAGGDKERLWESVKSAEQREGIVQRALDSEMADADSGPVLEDVTVKVGRTKAGRALERLRAQLDVIVQKREHVMKRMEVVSWREKVTSLAIRRAEVTDDCGWDQRLCFGDEEVVEFGSGVLESYTEWEQKADSKGLIDNPTPLDGSDETEWWCRGKRKCERHAGWQKLRVTEVEFDKEMKDIALERLTTRERAIRRDMEDISDPKAHLRIVAANGGHSPLPVSVPASRLVSSSNTDGTSTRTNGDTKKINNKNSNRNN